MECLIHIFNGYYVTALGKQNTPDFTQVATVVSGSQSEVCTRITWRAEFPIKWVWGGVENLPFSRAAGCWSGEHILRSAGPQHSALGGLFCHWHLRLGSTGKGVKNSTWVVGLSSCYFTCCTAWVRFLSTSLMRPLSVSRSVVSDSLQPHGL